MIAQKDIDNKVRINTVMTTDAAIILHGYGELTLNWFEPGPLQYRGWIRLDAGTTCEEVRKTYGEKEPLIAIGEVRIGVVIKALDIDRIDHPTEPIRLTLASTGAPH